MVFLVAAANDERESALAAERRSYDVALTVRNVSINVSRSEAALARFVLDEDVKTSGSIYANDWELAGYQIRQLGNLLRADPEQSARIDELKRLYAKRGDELALAARAAIQRQDQTGISYFYEAGLSGTGAKLDAQAQRNHHRRARSRCARRSSRAGSSPPPPTASPIISACSAWSSASARSSLR